MTAEEVKNELTDYHFLLEQVPKVYEHVTGGRMTKTNYYASAVISVADEALNERIEEALADEAEQAAQAQAGADFAEALRVLEHCKNTVANGINPTDGWSILRRAIIALAAPSSPEAGRVGLTDAAKAEGAA